jgi:hypothetical protein
MSEQLDAKTRGDWLRADRKARRYQQTLESNIAREIGARNVVTSDVPGGGFEARSYDEAGWVTDYVYAPTLDNALAELRKRHNETGE